MTKAQKIFLGLFLLFSLLLPTYAQVNDGQIISIPTLFEDLDAGGFDISNVGTITATTVAGTTLTISGNSTNDFITSNATPSYNFKDTDATDTDINSSIDVNLTTTTSALEDADISFKTQIAGALTEYINYDASGDFLYLGKNNAIKISVPGTFISFLSGYDLYISDDAFSYIGTTGDYSTKYDTNGTGDSIVNINNKKLSANDTACILISRDSNPNNMTLLDDCLSPTTLTINTEGADDGDFSGLLKGAFTQANVAIDNYTYEVAVVGSYDGSADATTTELAPFVVHGTTSATNDFSLAEGSEIFGKDVQIDGETFMVQTLHTTQGADLASATNLVPGLDGNSFQLTGTTKVDLISNIGRTDGDEITLICNESVTIDHGTATSTTNITILLDGGGDLSCTANDTLTLKLSSTTASGQAWREISRSVN